MGGWRGQQVLGSLAEPGFALEIVVAWFKQVNLSQTEFPCV